MKILLYIIIGLSLFSCTDSKKIFIIKNTNLFDGENYRTNVNIIVSNDSIVEITKKESWPTNSQIINGEGKTVIPPLLNAHVHAWQKENLKESLNAGVFGTFDMHTTDASAASLRYYREFSDHAYYYSSGPGATVPGGHGTEYGVTVPTIDSITSPEKFVDDRVKNGADYIKIFREPAMPTLNFSQTKQVIDAGHKHAKICVAHATILSDALILNQQGVDGLVHIWIDRTISKNQLDSLRASKIFMVPTLFATKKLFEQANSEKWNMSLISYEQLLIEIKKIYDSGIPILAGTDAPNYSFNYGDDYFEELKLLHEAGISPIEVLKAGTSNVYKSFKIKDFKKLEPGSEASFILVNGLPLNNFDCIDRVESIWKKGKKIK
ncbi:MAG: amidohydrolase family protein [Bacteroidia bacterium]|nr:amidohydrolase family protein [Bacteroidia bacterium]